jgi:hypothetical protein
MLTYEGNQNRECEDGTGVYEFDLAGHYVRMNVWPNGNTVTRTIISVDILCGPPENDADVISICYTEIVDPQDPLVQAALLFHEAVVREFISEEEAFQDFLRAPLIDRCQMKSWQ